ncbi:hypothetical protein MTR_6g471360 [Medicago truncatula]|uniref:Uncharacterized protein n=1 Tax=Medicago truncatula TaxID=3880 RepID=A0A072UCC5_MEDTR|nr:hypothetical protein MTR_6g471360 [Medicago truncatula]
MNACVVTPTSNFPPCGACGISGHSSIECKLGSVEQLNFIQNCQGISLNQNFHKNRFGEDTTIPGYANSQRVIQKSKIELLMENYFLKQSEQLQELKDQTRLLNDSLATLTSKVDFTSTHNNVSEIELSQVVHKVSQPKTNKLNAVTLRSGRPLEDTIGRAKPNESEKEVSKPQVKEARVERDGEDTTPPPFKPKPLSYKGSEVVKKAMCDLGASVSLMPLSLYERLGIGELKSTKMTLQLANCSVKYPAGIIEDVHVKVGEVPILLGRPFLATAGAIIDVKNGKLAFNVGKDTVEFELAKLMKSPSIKDSCCMIDIVDHCVKECSLSSTTNDGLEVCLVNNAGTKLEGGAQAYEELLDKNPPMEGLSVEELVNEEPTPIPKGAPKVELKPLPSNLKYEFLGPNSTYPVIVNASLDEVETEKLLYVLKKYPKAIGYTIDDIKGINPLLCMHRILLEEDYKPSIEHQRRLNPNMKEVVKNKS